MFRHYSIVVRAGAMAVLATCGGLNALAEESKGVTLIGPGVSPAAVVIPDSPEPIAQYAADEFVNHVEKATGARVRVLTESAVPDTITTRIYLGSTRAAAAVGIDVNALPSEAFVLRSSGNRVYVAAKDGPGDPLSQSNTYAGTLWGVYEILDRALGVRWLWPGELGTFVPKATRVELGPYNETVPPRFQQRQLRPQVQPNGLARGDARFAFSPEQRRTYAHDQSVFLRRHRMGCSAGTFFSERSFQSGHAFEEWWETYGAQHPEWFQLMPDGRRGPADPSRPRKFSMCVSNPELHKKIVELWQAERAKHPGEPMNICVGENDLSAECRCPNCTDWDGPPPKLEGLPEGLERSYLPVQAGTRYARFAKAVHALASEIAPDVQVHYYAYLNYFWAPPEDLKLSPNIVIGFVPWFRWAGWFPRTDAEQAWIKEQWMGWQRTGASVFYRPNWFLDGYSMPHIYSHQFADAFQFYARNGAIGTDFDSLQGQWAAQGPHLYLLARLHARPEAPVDSLIEEFYAAFGPAADAVREYFQYWEDYSTKNRERAVQSIKSRRGGAFRRYAMYAQVADELYPLEAFQPASAIIEKARTAAGGDSEFARRVAFLEEGLKHARLCVETAMVMNKAGATGAERKAALDKLVAYRRSVEALGIANLDRLSVIEEESWREADGFNPSAGDGE